MTMQLTMTTSNGGGASRFTIYHGLAASLALHAALTLPYFLSRLQPAEDDSTFIFEVSDLLSDDQADEKVQRDTAGDTQQRAQNATQAQPTPPTEQKPIEEDGAPITAKSVAAQARSPAKSAPAGSTQVDGAELQQVASTTAHRQVSKETLDRAYAVLVSKKIKGKLIYPEAGRPTAWRGVTKVSFFILESGEIRADSVKVASSSGQPQLDAAALQRVRASAPFAPPPRPMTFALDVVFGP
ncbi:TonB family protein [Methylosinus sporium]|uniref:TonB family protein n=1 Tax=Methylosinus sporium TaxID=428 RepID=A0A549T0I1_METSR|nr:MULTISPECIES: TonB family protein [Methylosinus]MBU3886812.1 TonB family protein [Methylosinus sp. KRF6]TRL35392.1 TonB family protein [Methylosinus sporium]